MLSAKLKGQYTSDQFRQASTELDNAEGKVTACGAGSGSNAYKYTLFGNSATVVATTTREKQGLLQGEIGLVNNDGWKVDSLATSLIGINLGALDTLGKFCQAYQTQNYSGAYALLAASLKTATTQEQFTSFQTLQDQVDGKVTACALEQITNGTDTDANVQVSLTRSTLGKRVGAVSLTAAGDSWAVSNVADDLQGTDLTGFVVGSTFCTDIVTGKFTEASAMVTANIATQLTKYGGLAGFFKLPAGYTYAGCTPDPTGYKVQSGEASFVSILKTQVGATPGPSLKLALTLTSGATAGSWQVAGIRVDLA